ncbi:tRNA-specific adenosine deaminase subunit tad3 [Colletotrichum orbiculare MAFF 240422]|uniref:tRNA-specific adenosine deaminase subunit tad3 n=1 Tax=Colletotrichum orbiculare (strain 104-T / ATCC 96160 / CBS 514.97 / LARS 414 / MAFF 240422) TaxID=1213857 RepID=A0A484FX79_COLOR|nr:tRNA-specific adenosine deaminase subunit tad3 [Colletotrichum orbiculare MAFF 240422]
MRHSSFNVKNAGFQVADKVEKVEREIVAPSFAKVGTCWWIKFGSKENLRCSATKALSTILWIDREASSLRGGVEIIRQAPVATPACHKQSHPLPGTCVDVLSRGTTFGRHRQRLNKQLLRQAPTILHLYTCFDLCPETVSDGSDSRADEVPEHTGPDIIQPHPLIDALLPKQLGRGVLIPLKTTLEIRQDHTIVQALLTRAPSKSTNDVVNLLRSMLPEGVANSLPHLRRCAKPGDIPAHLKTQFMNDSPEGRQVHTGKSTWIYIMLGEEKDFDKQKLVASLAAIEGMGENIFLTSIPIPLIPPTSQVQAAMWTSQFWPTVYRKNNPLGPHPSMVGRSTDTIRDETSLWMSLAHQAAHKAKQKGIGEPMGAVIVQREGGKSQLVAIAGDARWHQEPSRCGTGNPMGHSVLRAISMVAQKLVRHERRAAGRPNERPILEYDTFQDRPLLEEEAAVFKDEHPNADGYLCHGMELYLTHEPCVQCSMAILHSRMGKVVFAQRMPLTGGMCSEDRGHGHPELASCGGGEGLGLFWRRELNWSLLAWEWESSDCVGPLPPVDHRVHA